MYGNIQAAVTAMLDVVHPGDEWQAKYDWYFALVKEGDDLFQAARSVLDNIDTSPDKREWALWVFTCALNGTDPHDNGNWLTRQWAKFLTLFNK